MGHFEKGRWVKDDPVGCIRVGCIRFIAPDGGIPMKSGKSHSLQISITQDRNTGKIIDTSCIHSIEPGEDIQPLYQSNDKVEIVASYEFKGKNELIGNSE